MKTYIHLILLVVFSVFIASCSNDDSTETPPKLVLSVSNDDIEKGSTVIFEVTANGEPVTDAEIYIDGQPISGLDHTFADKGNYNATAKKSGHIDSEPITISVYQTDVYAAGYEYTSSGPSYIAKYWKNGNAVLLSDGGQNEVAHSIFVTDESDVYVCGTAQTTSGNVARYWVNNTPMDLTTSGSASAQSIKAYNNTVYIAGRVFDGSVWDAKLWIDGNVTTLNNGIVTASAFDVFVNENDVYVSGYQHNGNFIEAAYWKNGNLLTVGNGNYTGNATSIYVIENNVYIAGQEFNGSSSYVAKYWKNGTPHILTNGSNSAYVNDIFVYQDDVYAVGRETITSTSTAIVWKNGNRENLTNGTNDAIANSVYIMDGDVYVGGFEEINGSRVATIWKNGVPTSLSLSNSTSSAEVSSIFVHKQY